MDDLLKFTCGLPDPYRLVAIAVVLVLLIEAYLGSTNKVQANSILALIKNIALALAGVKTEEPKQEKTDGT